MKNIKLAIIIALEDELPFLFHDDKEVEMLLSGPYKVYTYQKNKDVIFIISGIGKANASGCMSWVATAIRPNNIVNLGYCGSTTKNIGDVLTISKTQYFDVDLTAFGYKKNQMAKEPVSFDVPNSLNIGSAIKANCFTSDSFVTKNNLSIFKRFGEINFDAIDMESAALAQTAIKFGIKNFCILKIVSDNSLLFEKDSSSQYSDSITDLSSKMQELMNNIIKNII